MTKHKFIITKKGFVGMNPFDFLSEMGLKVLSRFAYQAALRANGDGDSLDFDKAYKAFLKCWKVE